jgi:exodeoxyribonuclease-5
MELELVFTEEQENFMSSSIDIIDKKYKSKDMLNKEIGLVGYAGTGKTTITKELIARIRELKGKTGLSINITLLAPTNKAALVLRSKTDEECNTLHSMLYGAPFETETGVLVWKPASDSLRNNIVFVDESSMIQEELYKDLINLCKNCVIIFIGDDYQLEPVSKDKSFNIFNRASIEYFFLTEVKRVDNTVLQFLTRIRTEKNTPRPTETEDIVLAELTDKKKLFDFLDESEDCIMICGSNKSRVKYNNIIREHKGIGEFVLTADEPLISINNSIYANGEIFKLPFYKDSEGWKIVDTFYTEKFGKIYYYKNSRSIENKDGSVSEKIDRLLLLPEITAPSAYLAQLAREIPMDLSNDLFILDDKERMTIPRDTIVCTYGSCTTAHKSQGSQWTNVAVWLEFKTKFWDNSKWFYTACSRTSSRLLVINKNLDYQKQKVDIPINFSNFK